MVFRLLITVTAIVTSFASMAQQNDLVVSDRFFGVPNAIHAFSDEIVLCSTEHGWYRGHLKTENWRLFLELNHSDGAEDRRYVGGGESAAFFIEQEEGQNPQLIRLASEYDNRSILAEGVTHAVFNDDEFGAIASKDIGISFTRNGGRTWETLERRASFDYGKIHSLHLIKQNGLVCIRTGGTGDIWYQPIPNKDIPTDNNGWSVKLPIAVRGVVGVKAACIWVIGSDILGLDEEDGAVRYRQPIDHQAIRILMNDDHMIVMYPTWAEFIHLNDGEWKLAYEHQFPNRICDASFYEDADGNSQLILAFEDGRLATWGPYNEDDTPTTNYLEMRFTNGPAVDNLRLQTAMDNLANKTRRLLELSSEVPERVREDVESRVGELEDLTAEQRIEWMIQEYENYLSSVEKEE